ncbi:hypothetical protein N7457_008539 [Penicillium paradoxum]|uniref:uncharacterized protein n=1 Tax=Penicillium paradoxum TaxID=176176 RepID=UPI002547301F|nr:uncharacterized protein N7457_008539 [Penicillium paradoxum]KAJ5773643.1 hypothetical protein N7457_008539 [Penicillium paradoxum]
MALDSCPAGYLGYAVYGMFKHLSLRVQWTEAALAIDNPCVAWDLDLLQTPVELISLRMLCVRGLGPLDEATSQA